MIPSVAHNIAPHGGNLKNAAHLNGLADQTPHVKVGTILDEEGGGFGLVYDDTRGQKNQMRLDSLTYEGAVREARSFLGIRPDDLDRDGRQWAVE